MKRKGRIEGIITGLVLGAAFLRVSFETDLPDQVWALIVAVFLGGGTLVLFLLLRRIGSEEKDSQESSSDE